MNIANAQSVLLSAAPLFKGKAKIIDLKRNPKVDLFSGDRKFQGSSYKDQALLASAIYIALPLFVLGRSLYQGLYRFPFADSIVNKTLQRAELADHNYHAMVQLLADPVKRIREKATKRIPDFSEMDEKKAALFVHSLFEGVALDESLLDKAISSPEIKAELISFSKTAGSSQYKNLTEGNVLNERNRLLWDFKPAFSVADLVSKMEGSD